MAFCCCCCCCCSSSSSSLLSKSLKLQKTETASLNLILNCLFLLKITRIWSPAKSKLISATPSAWLSTLFPCLTANKAPKISSPFRNSITTSNQGYKRTDYVPQVLFSKTSKKSCTANNIPTSPIAPIVETPSLLQPEKIPCANRPTNLEKTFQDVRDNF